MVFMTSNVARHSNLSVKKQNKEESEPYWNLAGKLISWSDIPNEDHTLLRENIATELSQTINNREAKNLVDKMKAL